MENITIIAGGTLSIVVTGGVFSSSSFPSTVTSLVINGTAQSDATSVAGFGTHGNKITVNNGITFNISSYDDSQNLSGIIKSGTPVINVTTSGSTLGGNSDDYLTKATNVYINSNTTTVTAAHLEDLIGKTTANSGVVRVNNGKTLIITAYTTQALGALTNEGSGTITVATNDNAALDSTALGFASSIAIITGTCTSTAAIANGFGTNGDNITVNAGGTLNISGYINHNISGITNNGTINVTTATGDVATISNTNLTKATAIIIACADANPAVGTAADALTLGPSKITVNASCTYNISAYTTQELGPLTNNGTINVTTINNADIDATNLADADTITIDAGTATGTAADAATLGPGKITVNNGCTYNISAYTTQDLTALIRSGTPSITVTTINGATLVSASLDKVDVVNYWRRNYEYNCS